MLKPKIYLSLLASALIVFSSCKKEDEETITPDPTPSQKDLTLSITGLEDLGSSYLYEGWIMVDGTPVSAGTFSVDASGTMSKTVFSLDESDLNSATAYILTIEPSPDSDPAPSDVHILAGDFSSNSASLTVDHGAAIGTDFLASTGTYILATPTDGGTTDDENSGVWWLSPTGASTPPNAGLALPTLPAGWEYEGWAVINGMPVSTGKFTSVTGSDDAAAFSGSSAGPAFPGEDFLMNAPMGLTFPTDLAGATVVISVEPMPDNEPAPFVLKPLVHGVPAAAIDHTPYMMMNNAAATNPVGTASK